MATTDNLGPVYTGMSQDELLKLIEAAKATVPPPATEEQKEFARRYDESQDPGGRIRQQFIRPPRGPVAPIPRPRPPEGLMATPQVQEPKEEADMFDFSAIKEYITNMFNYRSPTSPDVKVPLESESKEKKDISETGIPEQRVTKPVRYSKKYSSNNPGNVERLRNDLRAGESPTEGYGTDKRFPKFDHPVMGLRAIFMDMNTKVKRHNGNLKKMIAEYAPKNENKTKKYYEFVKNKIGKEKINSKSDIRKAVEAIVEYENKGIDDGKLVNFYLSKENNFMDEAEQLSKLNLPGGTSYEMIVAGDYSVEPKKIQVAQKASGGRLAKNPNPYTPKAI